MTYDEYKEDESFLLTYITSSADSMMEALNKLGQCDPDLICRIKEYAANAVAASEALEHHGCFEDALGILARAKDKINAVTKRARSLLNELLTW